MSETRESLTIRDAADPRRGFVIDSAVLSPDFSQHTVGNDSVQAAGRAVHRDTTKHWGLYEIAEEWSTRRTGSSNGGSAT